MHVPLLLVPARLWSQDDRENDRAARRRRKEAYAERRIQFRMDFLVKRLDIDFAFQVDSWVEYFNSNREKIESSVQTDVVEESARALSQAAGCNVISIRMFNEHFANGRLSIDHLESCDLDVPCNVPMLIRTGSHGFLRFVRNDAPDEIISSLFDIDDWMADLDESTGKLRAFNSCPIDRNFGRGHGCSFPDCVVAAGRQLFSPSTRS